MRGKDNGPHALLASFKPIDECQIVLTYTHSKVAGDMIVLLLIYVYLFIFPRISSQSLFKVSPLCLDTTQVEIDELTPNLSY